MISGKKIHSLLPWVVFALAVLICRLLCIHFYRDGISISWDQWEGEAIGLYPKWLAGTLGIHDLVAGHNEHRLLITRLYNLALFYLNGNSWSIMLQVRANALLHVLTLVMFLYLAGREFTTWQRWVLSLVGCLVFSIPYAYENILCGFQSQFYFLELVSILLLASASFLNGKNALMIVLFLAMLAPFTMASGPLAIFVALVVLAIKLGIQHGDRTRERTTYLLILVVTVIACLAIVLTPKVAGHDQFKARNLHQFIEALVQVFSWPLPSNIIAAIFMQMPLLLFACYFLRKIKTATPQEIFLFSLVFWLWLQLASLAYGRAVLVWSSRYKDLYALSSVLGVTSILMMLNPIRGSKISWREIMGGLWIMIMAAGFLFSIREVMNQLEFVKKFTMEQKKSLGIYLTTGDESALHNKTQLNMPHPDPERLKWILSKPEYKSISDKACLDVSIPIKSH
jgi:hypothetical protein